MSDCFHGFRNELRGYALMFIDGDRDLDIYRTRTQPSNTKIEHTRIVLKNTKDAKFEFIAFGNKSMPVLIWNVMIPTDFISYD